MELGLGLGLRFGFRFGFGFGFGLGLGARRAREHLAPHALRLHGRDHVELLGAQRVDPARTRRLGELVEQLGGLGVLLGLAVELDRVQLLPGGEEVRGVLGEYLVKGVLGLGRGLGLRLGLG